MRFIGDIHGCYTPYIEIAKQAEKSVQVGDFGVGFGDAETFNAIADKFHADGNHRFIRGNHDDPVMCKERVGYIPDGTYENGVMYIGGAKSTDIQYRLMNGLKWWEDEELSYDEFILLLHKYEELKPDIMVTHDAPKRFVPGYSVHSLTRNALDIMFEIHQPRLWIFGHHHTRHTDKILGCEFVCLGINDYIDITI